MGELFEYVLDISQCVSKCRSFLGEKYKQLNAAFDAGYASALNKSIIVIHNDEHQHALKEVDASAAAVAKDQNQVVRILKYVIDGEL